MKLRRQCKWLHSLLVCFCIAATVITHSEARLSKHRLIKGTQNLNHLRSPTTKRLKHLKHFEIDPLSSGPGNTQPYVSSPFSLPPFESLGPIPLPQNAPPYCENPPSSQQPPSTTLPSPTTNPTPPAPPFSSYPTPNTPSSQSPPSSPIGGGALSPPGSPTLPGTGPSVPGTNPPEGSPNPSPPWYGPSPPEIIFPGAPPLFPGPPETGPGTGVPSPSPPSYVPLPPYYGSNPPGIIPSPPNYVPGSPKVLVPSPPFYAPGPPSYGSNPPGTTPSPPQYAPYPPPYFPNPPLGFLPSPPVFLPPVVYPPPLGPPTPYSGPHLPLWCVAKPSVPDPIIQEAMDYACFSGADCSSIGPSGSCFEPNNLAAHASYAFNSYWQRTKSGGGTCDFGGTAILVTVDPSFDGCIFLRY